MMHDKDLQTQLERKVVAKKKMFSGIQLFFAIMVTLGMAFPLYWMLNISFKSPEEMVSAVPTFFPIHGFYLKSYSDAIRIVPILRYILNTVVVTAIQLGLQLSFGILAAYGFARGRFRGKNALFILVLGALMIPQQVTFIPLYLLIAKLNWVDTYAGLIFPSSVSAYMIFMLRQNFLSVDQSYLDAGKIDGLGILGTIHHIMVPMCRSSIITVGLVSIIDGWNNYFWPKIIARSDASRTIAVGLALIKSNFMNEVMEHYNIIMASVAISMIPIVIIFVCFQKYMLSGYSKAAMK